MKTNKIEKLEVPDLIVGNVYTNREQVDIINKINEIISVLNSWIFEPTLTIPSQSQKQPEKQEEWERELRFTYGHLYYQNEEGEFCQIVNEIDDLIDFISKLLKEKTFSKEELNRLSIWSGDVGSFGVVSDEDAELINKIYKLLDGEKENE